MRKDLTPILLFLVILAFESAPFLYKEDYSVSQMSWLWILGLPIVLLILNKVRNSTPAK